MQKDWFNRVFTNISNTIKEYPSLFVLAIATTIITIITTVASSPFPSAAFFTDPGGSPMPSSSPAASPSPTPTIEPSPSPSPTPEISPTPEVSPSPTPTVEPSPSPSPTPEVSPSPTPTVEPSPSPSASPEVSPTPEVSPSPTPTVDPSPSPSASPEISPEPSPSPSASPEVSPTPEVSPSPTVEPSPSPSPEVSPTPEVTPSPTPTVEPSPSPSPSSNPSSNSSNGGGGGSNDPGTNSPASPPQCSAATPTTVTNLRITNQGTNSITLAWNAATPVSHYALIFTRVSDGEKYGATNIGNATSYVITGISGQAQYTFEVFGVNDCKPGDRASVTSTVIAGPVLVARPSGGDGQVLGATTEVVKEVVEPSPTPTVKPSPKPTPKPEVLGTTTEVCTAGNPWLPVIFLAVQVLFLAIIEYNYRTDKSNLRFYLTAGITAVGVGLFYLLGGCNCDPASWQGMICQWFWLMALVLGLSARTTGFFATKKD